MFQRMMECKLLSPVHIGTGDTIDPIQYVIKRGHLFRFSVDSFLINADPIIREQFEEIIQCNDPVMVRQFIDNHIDLEKYGLYSCRVSGQVEALYSEKRLSADNQLQIFPYVRCGTSPIIPGSSVKGAIRTAVISHLAISQRMPIPKDFNEEKLFENNVLGYRDAGSDPFRMLKIADSNLDANQTIITNVVNFSSKREKKDSSIQLLYEMTDSMLSGRSVVFNVQVAIDEHLAKTNFIKKKLSYELIAEACNAFYKPIIEMEHKSFFRNSPAEKFSKTLLDLKLSPGEFFLRIGRFSGVESVTLDKYRKPRPPGKGKTWGTTRNLAEGTYPMGWVLCSIS